MNSQIISTITDINILNNFSDTNLIWCDNTELLLNKWKSESYKFQWIHNSSFRYLRFMNYIFNIPVIILSTILGSLNFGRTSITSNNTNELLYSISGVINIFIGILTTISNFFRFAQTSEAHFRLSLQWAKLNRTISNELILDKNTRINAYIFIKACKEEYEHLMEQAPIIPTYIIYKFNYKHPNYM